MQELGEGQEVVELWVWTVPEGRAGTVRALLEYHQGPVPEPLRGAHIEWVLAPVQGNRDVVGTLGHSLVGEGCEFTMQVHPARGLGERACQLDGVGWFRGPISPGSRGRPVEGVVLGYGDVSGVLEWSHPDRWDELLRREWGLPWDEALHARGFVSAPPF